jgi:hypothetical protein
MLRISPGSLRNRKVVESRGGIERPGFFLDLILALRVLEYLDLVSTV